MKHPKNTAILNYKYHNEEGTKVNEKEWNVNAGLCTSGGIWNRMFFKRSVGICRYIKRSRTEIVADPAAWTDRIR